MLVKIIFSLFLSHPFSLNALTNDVVQKRCQNSLSNLPNYNENPYHSSILQISNLVKDIIKKVPHVKIKDLPNTLTNCLEGVDAMIWLIEQKQTIVEKNLGAIEESIQIKRSLQKEKPDEDVKKSKDKDTANTVSPLTNVKKKDTKKKKS